MHDMVKNLKKMTFNLSSQEVEHLEAYCEYVARSKTDVLRELIRSLPDVRKTNQSDNTKLDIVNEG